MPPHTHTDQLPLPDLDIIGFRGLSHLSIPRLARVTLLTGMNGVGKTTLLDAVRLFADRGSSFTLRGILRDRDEIRESPEEEGASRIDLDWTALFFGRAMDDASVITIGPSEGPSLSIRMRAATPKELERYLGPFSDPIDSDLRVLSSTYGKEEKTTPLQTVRNSTMGTSRFRTRQYPSPIPPIQCKTIGPEPLKANAAAELWDDLALKDEEASIISSLNLVTELGPQIERVTIVGNARTRTLRPIVRRAGESEPIPLKSLGEGVLRIFGIALTLASSRTGFLLIDEVENGIHHSVQESFWTALLDGANRNQVQVIATTHSWDAVAGYARAVTKDDRVDGALYRIERRGNSIRAVAYTEAELVRVADNGNEVR